MMLLLLLLLLLLALMTTWRMVLQRMRRCGPLTLCNSLH
jgi:hypothetical protein